MSDINEQRALLADTVDKLFRDLAEARTQAEEALEQGQLAAGAWQSVEDMGIAGVFVPEADGGFGGGWEDAFVVLNRAGYHAVALPIAETLLAQRLLSKAGMTIPQGPIAIVQSNGLRIEDRNGQWRIDGAAVNVPWGNAVPHLLVASEDGGRVALVARESVQITATRHNIAREPAADLRFEHAAAIACFAATDKLFESCALLRAAQIAGALDAALERAVQYANERVQFGKPIGKLQAIQQSLALVADEVAAVNCAALVACRAADRGDAGFEIAAAKLRANRAVGVATSVAHQVHGAIGFTREHALHFATQRLWSWRAEYGNDRYWATRLGAMVAKRGAEGFWADLTARSDA